MFTQKANGPHAPSPSPAQVRGRSEDLAALADARSLICGGWNADGKLFVARTWISAGRAWHGSRLLEAGEAPSVACRWTQVFSPEEPINPVGNISSFPLINREDTNEDNGSLLQPPKSFSSSYLARGETEWTDASPLLAGGAALSSGSPPAQATTNVQSVSQQGAGEDARRASNDTVDNAQQGLNWRGNQTLFVGRLLSGAREVMVWHAPPRPMGTPSVSPYATPAVDSRRSQESGFLRTNRTKPRGTRSLVRKSDQTRHPFSRRPIGGLGPDRTAGTFTFLIGSTLWM
ncbi:hypothetical protein BDK51DRAFT_48231 [Blyttiomyces helicus]|uniref:Uncharacterized protein n=1 Tax=Blyttiomyces helicus TaxID=388810 RepID=A0A4P9W9K2_9FUNG|nr:hypothetical protein BDK51DRAFT_48231 [Blyttiomyces helicus]|eukprot:RKO89241.1 hypothetical protein BDK51DRAFT_48231 [Blyttiomyces helicus]